MNKKLSEFIPPAFHSLWRAVLDPNILHVVENGGSSCKSSYLAHCMTQLLISNILQYLMWLRVLIILLDTSSDQLLMYSATVIGLGHAVIRINQGIIEKFVKGSWESTSVYDGIITGNFNDYDLITEEEAQNIIKLS